MKITLLEVVRGEEAWKRIKEASPSNKAAETGFEYVLARLKFEYYARGTPGLCIHHLSPQQFSSVSLEGQDYQIAQVVLPKPELRSAWGLEQIGNSGMIMTGDKASLMTGERPDSPRLIPNEQWLEFRRNPLPKTIPRIKGGHYREWTDAIRGEQCESPGPHAPVISFSALKNSRFRSVLIPQFTGTHW